MSLKDRSYWTGHRGTSPQFKLRPEDPRREIERGFHVDLMRPLHIPHLILLYCTNGYTLYKEL